MATISSDVLASYAADAAREVEGVRSLVESTLHRHKGVRVLEAENGVRIELHIAVDWSTPIPEVAQEIQRRVSAYLAQMASVEAGAVDVVVDEIGPP
jgi:uncharacterized alkaline shock family protein YloU